MHIASTGGGVFQLSCPSVECLFIEHDITDSCDIICIEAYDDVQPVQYVNGTIDIHLSSSSEVTLFVPSTKEDTHFILSNILPLILPLFSLLNSSTNADFTY